MTVGDDDDLAEATIYAVYNHLDYFISAHRNQQSAARAIQKYHDANTYHIEQMTAEDLLERGPPKQERKAWRRLNVPYNPTDNGDTDP